MTFKVVYNATPLGESKETRQTPTLWAASPTPFGFLKSRHRPLRQKDIRTLVFVHGYATNRAGFFPLQTDLALRGHGRQYAFNDWSSGSIESLAIELEREIDENVKGGRIDLVCHSMGGIVARSASACGVGPPRVVAARCRARGGA